MKTVQFKPLVSVNQRRDLKSPFYVLAARIFGVAELRGNFNTVDAFLRASVGGP